MLKEDFKRQIKKAYSFWNRWNNGTDALKDPKGKRAEDPELFKEMKTYRNRERCKLELRFLSEDAVRDGWETLSTRCILALYHLDRNDITNCGYQITKMLRDLERDIR